MSEYYRLHHDFETFSYQKLPAVGAARYAMDYTTYPLMCAYAFNDEPEQQWVPEEGEKMPSDLKQAIEDPYCIKFAWNMPFEWCIWHYCLGITIPFEQCRDVMVMSYQASLPGKLETAAKILELPSDQQKIQEGRTLMRTFSQPRSRITKRLPYDRVMWWMEPEKWEGYKEYNRGDVRTERGAYKVLKPYDMSRDEWYLWYIDQQINFNGIPINVDLVENAIKVYDFAKAKRVDKMNKLTGLPNANSEKQLLPWIKEQGYPFDDCKKGHIERGKERALEDMEEVGQSGYVEEARQFERLADVLALRLEAARTSPTKYKKLKMCVDPVEHVIRWAFQFQGAGRTGRDAGRLYQAQNLPRPERIYEKCIELCAQHLQTLDPEVIELIYQDVMGLLATCVRPTAYAPEGKVFVASDLSAIENIVLGWLSHCRKILTVFENNLDPYIAFAVYLFGGKYQDLYDEYKGGEPFKRQISKPGVLGCGYRLSAGEEKVNRKTGEIEGTGLLGYAWNMGVKEFTMEQSELSVDTFRREFEEVKEYWYGIENAAKRCINRNKRIEFDKVIFDRDGPFMTIELPSTRKLRYCRPRVEDCMMPWGETKPAITYDGLNDRKQWIRIQTHGGKLTENVDQAIARDIMMSGMKLAYKRGLDIRLRVHDELVCLSDEDRADPNLELLKDCMMHRPAWGRDIPLQCGGYVSKFFKKD